jgi:hypothetical protein
MSAMVLGRARADPQAPGDHFVQVAFDKQCEYFPLAGCQPLKAGFRFLTLGTLLCQFVPADESLVDNLEQSLGIERFLDKMQRAGTHGLHRDWHIGLSGHDDEDCVNSPAGQLPLKLEAVHAWQANVDQRANRAHVFE